MTGEETDLRASNRVLLRMYVTQVLAMIDRAMSDTGATHVHCGVQVDPFGSTNCGPILSYDFTDDGEDFGYMEIRNYAGDTVRTPLRLAKLQDVYPCWDTSCDPARTPEPGPGPGDDEPESAPPINPDARGPLREEPDHGYDPYAGTGYDDA
jgi:hypothetical protein